MISLIVDTESTGFALKGVPASDPRQARVLQLAAILLDEDKEVASFYSKLYPDNWPAISAGAEAAHGITLADCERTGIAQKVAIDVIDEFLLAADVVVAHNYRFDYGMLTIEYELQGKIFAPKSHACTMEMMTSICGLTKTNGSPKWPNLAEALQHIKDDTVTNHDALADAKGCAQLWKWLVANGYTPQQLNLAAP